MRQARLKAPPGHGKAYYHCISRVVNRDFVLGRDEKEMFVKLMRRWEKFCQVRIITFCVMSNHFHLLVEVTPPPAVLPSDKELMALLGEIYSEGLVAEWRERLKGWRKSGSEEAAEEWRRSVFQRMWDVSGFMKVLKQQFTQWFNGCRERKGTLWEERFKSMLVEGAGSALATMAAYIDLNPVRAGLVDDPKDYRWCGYAAAVAGGKGARAGLATVIEALHRPCDSAKVVLGEYRVRLYFDGEQRGLDDPGRGVGVRRGLSPEEVARVVKEKGRLTAGDMLRCRVRYFVDGAVLGSREFVNGVFDAERARFGAKRKDGARRLRFIEADDLRVLRDLRLRPIG